MNTGATMLRGNGASGARKIKLLQALRLGLQLLITMLLLPILQHTDKKQPLVPLEEFSTVSAATPHHTNLIGLERVLLLQLMLLLLQRLPTTATRY